MDTAKRRCSPSGKRSGLFAMLWCGGFAENQFGCDDARRQFGGTQNL